jgi:hypothetical protein
MSVLRKYFAGIQFRERKPEFEAGSKISAFLTDAEGDDLIARIGDSKVLVTDAGTANLNDRVLIEISETEDCEYTARGNFIKRVGEGSFG